MTGSKCQSASPADAYRPFAIGAAPRRLDRVRLRAWTLSLVVSLSGAGSVGASTLSELRTAWKSQTADAVAQLRDSFLSQDTHSQFQADYMLATAQCATAERQRQRAGLALLKQLPDSYDNLELVDLGIVYTAVRRCRGILNEQIVVAANAAPADSWIDPQLVGADVGDGASDTDGGAAASDNGGPGLPIPAAGIEPGGNASSDETAQVPSGDAPPADDDPRSTDQGQDQRQYDPNEDEQGCPPLCIPGQMADIDTGGTGPASHDPAERMQFDANELVGSGATDSESIANFSLGTSAFEMLEKLGRQVALEGLDSQSADALFRGGDIMQIPDGVNDAQTTVGVESARDLGQTGRAIAVPDATRELPSQQIRPDLPGDDLERLQAPAAGIGVIPEFGRVDTFDTFEFQREVPRFEGLGADRLQTRDLPLGRETTIQRATDFGRVAPALREIQRLQR